MTILVVFLVLSLTRIGFSQTLNDQDNSSSEFFVPMFCGTKEVISLANLIKNRNSTFNELRKQLLSTRALYARAQDSSAGVPVFAAIQCWNYLTPDQCVACFDHVASTLSTCTSGNGAKLILDSCFLRYEDFGGFYTNPYVTGDGYSTSLKFCSNQSASNPTAFNQIGDGFLSDIRDATPKVSNFSVASLRQITSDNATMYVTTQCIENIDKAVCQTCMNRAYDKLNDCLPSTEGRYYDVSCYARYSDTPFFDVNQTIDITAVLKAGHSSKVAVIAGAIGAGVLVLLILLSLLLYRSWKMSQQDYALPDTSDFKGAIHFHYTDLQMATNNFSEQNVLGKGGFGVVFKAVLDDKNVVAVKKLEMQEERVKEEFENEIKLISNIHHRNLLRLLGWSIEGSYLFLVLEYMPNGSLDMFLWGAKRGTLSWNQRYEIIHGIARGLAHLHEEFHIKIVHRDIKSSNILLGDDLKPKIADFGLARLQPEDRTHVTTKFAGTLGYTAPEYLLRGVLSEKVDVYSFGIVILEIISGRKCTDVNSNSQASDYLLQNTWNLYEKKTHIKVIDETLNLNQNEQEDAMKMIEIALLCTQSPSSLRPTMSEVVLMLQERQSFGKRQLTRPTFVNNPDRRIV